MPKQNTILNVVLVTLGVCAVVLTGAVLNRGSNRPSSDAQEDVVVVKNWAAYGEVGNRMGPHDARVVVVEFSDFQCPYCRSMGSNLDSLRKRYPRDVAVVYRHFPIDRLHPLARAAAAASECAAESDRFAAYHDLLFADSTSLLRAAWTRLALKAGVTDTLSFSDCLRSGRGAARVARDVSSSQTLRIDRTPTILVNQFRIVGAPRPELIDSLVKVSLR